ncbi:MAG: Sua5/YciO/YrdC/YwlC family protein [Natronospirillum sp.]|uniref:L-threonylcarbamoyladenylate synthase n=1 Tax=Natronospirillum sp. TaxID=2812955 RepID=UPI0025E418C3|nr:Sua5/YciO/YrdC/YwlC family protein [Natronospirillum sp.]MCH8552191.1 Sua5/YciO/YrdC/YwlC family protein [Natronospirillum sp.]
MTWLAPEPIRQVFFGGGLLAYPTEAVWGLGCDPFNATAVTRLLALKQRPVAKGLILVAGDWWVLAPWLAHLSAEQQGQLRETWPGPVTWLIPRPPGMPYWITGQHDSLAVRLSAHPTVRQLTRATGVPLVSTSANRSGHRAARHGWQVRQWLGDSVELYVPGRTGGATRPSTIRDLATGAILR